MPDVPELRKGSVLGFDFGTKRIGVAVGELELRQGHALTTIASEINEERFKAIEALIAEWRPVCFVVGIPSHLDGAPHEMTARCTRFANQLRGRYRLPVYCVDERLSSAHAEELLRESGKKTKSAKGLIDAMAAQVILQDFFIQLSHDVTGAHHHANS